MAIENRRLTVVVAILPEMLRQRLRTETIREEPCLIGPNLTLPNRNNVYLAV